MIPPVLHWSSLDTVRLLFWGTILTCSGVCLSDQTLRSKAKRGWKVGLCVLVLTLLWRIPPDGHFYHGLEYEDSYVYTVAARQLLDHTPGNEAPIGFPYSISTCAAGSLRSCSDWQTFSEHLIGSAYAFSAYSKLMGYTPDVGGWVALCAALVSCCLIAAIASIISEDSMAATSGAVIFAITPVFAVQGLESSAEPVSNAAISIVVFLLVYALRYLSGLSVWRAILVWMALALSVAFAMTVKRENALLLLAVPLLLVTLDPRDAWAGPRRRSYIVGVLSLSVVCGLFALRLNIVHTGGWEFSLVSQFRPTPHVVFRIALAFLRSLVVPAWYLCGFVFVVWGMIASRREKLSLAVTLLLLGYLALYALHIRGYYEMRSGESDPRAALRFEMSLMSLWSLLGGLGVAAAFRRFGFLRLSRQTWPAIIGGCMVLGLLTLSYADTRSLRMDAVEDEAQIRVAPAVKAAQLDSERAEYIITFEPLVVQMYADSDTKVLDIDVISMDQCRTLGLLSGAARAILIDEDIHHSAADADRYSEQLSFLASFKRTAVYSGEGFAVARINFVQEQGGGPTEVNRGQD